MSKKKMVSLTLNNLVEECGYKPNSHKGKSNAQFQDILELLEDLKYISCTKEILFLKPSEFIKTEILDSDALFNPSTPYVVFDENEFERIVNSDSNIDKGNLLLAYLSIKQYINMHSNSYKICALGKSTLRNEFNVSSNSTVDGTLNQLEKMGLIYYKACGCYIQDGVIKNAPTCYALDKAELRNAERFLNECLNIKSIIPKVCDNLTAYHDSKGFNKERLDDSSEKESKKNIKPPETIIDSKTIPFKQTFIQDKVNNGYVKRYNNTSYDEVKKYTEDPILDFKYTPRPRRKRFSDIQEDDESKELANGIS